MLYQRFKLEIGALVPLNLIKTSGSSPKHLIGRFWTIGMHFMNSSVKPTHKKRLVFKTCGEGFMRFTGVLGLFSGWGMIFLAWFHRRNQQEI